MGTGAAAADPRRWLALAVITASTMMVVLDVSIVNIALPHAQADLGISDASRHWVGTAYALSLGGLLLLGGRVADFVGRKRAFVVGLAGFAAASAFRRHRPERGDAVRRALQGAFAALLTPAALSLIAVTFADTGGPRRSANLPLVPTSPSPGPDGEVSRGLLSVLLGARQGVAVLGWGSWPGRPSYK